jgi:hypothetical protein
MDPLPHADDAQPLGAFGLASDLTDTLLNQSENGYIKTEAYLTTEMKMDRLCGRWSFTKRR